MTLSKIEALLEKRIGLCSQAIGPETVEKAAYRRMKSLGLADLESYFKGLETSEAEQENLIEEVVVPETWFFRNRKSYIFLGNHVKFEWINQNDRRLKILSIPCSTGEEPYSIAMALLEKGIPKERFRIDAVDVSHKALDKAKIGIYGPGSFRGDDLSFRDRYFEKIADYSKSRNAYRISDRVKETVQFHQGNLMDENLLKGKDLYDIIFFRNLLIYFSTSAKERSIQIIDRLLVDDGLLFVGHAERPIINGAGLVWAAMPGVFACRKADGFKYDRFSYGFELAGKTNRKKIKKPGKLKSVPVETGKSPWPPNDEPPARLDDQAPEIDKLTEMLDEAGRLADRGRLKEAFQICRKCLSKDAFHVQTHFLMGLISHAMNDEEKAETFFNKALYLDPNHHEAISHLAFIMEHRGETDKAARFRERANRIMRELRE